MKDTVIVVTRPGLGTTPQGDEAFGVEMLDNMFHTFEKLQDRPTAVCFYTAGVKLLAPGSPLTLSLQLLERLGVRMIACGTCLDHFQIGPDLVAGQRATMVDIVQLMSDAQKVITV